MQLAATPDLALLITKLAGYIVCVQKSSAQMIEMYTPSNKITPCGE